MQIKSIPILSCFFFLIFFQPMACMAQSSNIKKPKTQALYDTLMAQKKRQDAAAALRRQRTQNKNNQAVFGDEDPIFKNNMVPDKWKDQSAVILASKITYHYHTGGSNAYFDWVERRRIKIQDKSAIDDLSTFYFIPTNDVGFMLIKKDGTIVHINLNDAVPVDQYIPVPISYIVGGSSSYTYSKSYKKIAISGLEPGDIIDYYYRYSSYSFKDGIAAVPFAPIEYTLTGDYPVIIQQIKLQAEKGFFINCASYNGAGTFKRIADTLPDNNSYLLIDTNLNQRKNEKWEDPFRCEPTVKFQVVYSNNKDKETVPYFLGTFDEPVTSVSQDQLKRVANEIALESNPTIESYSSAIIKYMRKNHSDIQDPVLYMKYAYTYFRYFLMIGDVGDDNESGFSEDIDDNMTNKRTVQSDIFINTLGLVCRDKKIDYDILFGMPRNMGTLDNLIYPDELSWAIYIKGTPGTYLYPFDSYKTAGEGEQEMEGIDMYRLVPDKKPDKAIMTRTTSPSSGDADNYSVFKTTATLDADMQGGASVERYAEVGGLIKEHYYPDVITESDMLNNELRRYKEETMEDYLKKIHNDAREKEEEKKLTEAKADEQKERLDDMKSFFSGDFDFASYNSFKLICEGRQLDSTKLIFSDKFKLTDILHKAGPNYVLDIGKLIGKQLEIKDDERKRTDDIYLGYAGEYDNEVSIVIPAGYTVQGVDALNKSITTPAGGFVSTATLHGNLLQIKTKKFYLQNFEPQANWPDMLKFLDAAYDFTQAKVLLKKA